MSWPPWWLILVWIVMVPIGIRMLVNPTKIWSRSRREWAEDHPGDDYSSGWLAQTEFQAIFGLGLVAIATAGWLVHGYDAAHKHRPSPAPTRTDAAGAVAVMPVPTRRPAPATSRARGAARGAAARTPPGTPTSRCAIRSAAGRS